MNPSQDINRLLGQVRDLPPELSLEAVQQIIETFPPSPPPPRWSDFITLNTKWMFLLIVTLVGSLSLLPFNDFATLKSPANNSLTEATSPNPTMEGATLDEQTIIAESATLPPITQQEVAGTRPVKVEKETEMTPSVSPAEEQLSSVPDASNGGFTKAEIPELGYPNKDLIKESMQLETDVKKEVKTGGSPNDPFAGTDGPTEDRVSVPQPVAFIGDTTLVGAFRELEVRGKARIFIEKGEQNLIIIQKKAGVNQVTSVKETSTGDHHGVKVSLKAKGRYYYDVKVVTTNLERLKIDPDAKAYYLNELGDVQLTNGFIQPAEEAKLPEEIREPNDLKNIRPFKWGSCGGGEIQKTVPLNPFNKVIVKGNVRVVIKREPNKSQAEVMALPNAADNVEFEIEDQVLTISLKAAKKLQYDVQLTTPTLEEIVVRSKSCVYTFKPLGDIKVKGKLCLAHNFENSWIEPK